MSGFEKTAEIARLVGMLGQTRRVTEHPDGELESDTTHSVMVALIAAWVAPQEEVSLNLDLVMMYALVHDLPEAIAGDVSTMRPLTPEARKAKDEAEARAVEEIDGRCAWLGDWIASYERQDTPEARFVRVIDKIMPKFTHAWNGCRVVKRHGVDLAELEKLHRDQAASLRAYAPEFRVAHDLYQWTADRAHKAHAAGAVAP